MHHVTKTGIYQNTEKRRWEYWYVGPNDIKVLVSWLSWNRLGEYRKWEKDCLIGKAG